MKRRIVSILVSLAMCLTLLPANALAFEIISPPHTCADENGDYLCDLCWEIIPHDCVDGGDEESHYCDLCYEYLRELCADENGDHTCEVCFTILTDLCVDEDPVDHRCDNENCSHKLTECEDTEGDDNICDLCDKGIYPSAGGLNIDVAAENGQFVVTWEPLEDVGEDKVVSYTVYCYKKEEGGSFDAAVKAVYTPDQQVFTHTFTDLEFDVTYEIGVCAEYESGFSADQSTAEALYSLWIGGTQVTSENHWDVFEDGTVSYDPDNATLTLERYQYEGDGYQYYSDDTDGTYSAVICSGNDLNIELVGGSESVITNTFTDLDNDRYGDGLYVKGSLSITGSGLEPGINAGPGSLIIDGCYGIDSGENVSITDCSLYITASNTGIYAYDGLSITDSVVDITAENDGIYSFDGGITIDCTEVAASLIGPGLVGTRLYITTGEGNHAFPLISDIEPLVISDRLTISTPEGGKIQRFDSRWDSDDDGIDDTDYVYDIIVDTQGDYAHSVTIEPLGYNVTITGLSFVMDVTVPVGQSVNETHRDTYGFEDFSELLVTDKENYTFVGWYTDPGFGNKFTFDTPVTEDITLYPLWVSDSPSSGGSSTPTYTPTVEQTEGGAVSISPKRPEKGDTVTITPDPDFGMIVTGVTVTDKDGKPVEVTDNGDGTFSFIQPKGKVSIAAGFACGGGEGCPGHGFADVAPDAWYHSGVDYVVKNGLMQGVGGGSFAPDAVTTRAMLWTVLAKLDGVDTTSGELWYEAAQSWAVKQNISDGSDPNASITREQFVTMLYAYSKYKGIDVSVGEDTNILSYEDAFDISEWAIPAMQWACGSGLMQGDGVNLMPVATATRAQSAVLLASFCENMK